MVVSVTIPFACVACATAQGTHTGCAMRGVPPTGQQLTCKGVTTLRLQHGRIIDKLSHANGSDLMRQLQPQQIPKTAADI